MICPSWCVHHGADRHPTLDDPLPGCPSPAPPSDLLRSTVEHVRPVVCERLAAVEGEGLAVEVVLTVEPDAGGLRLVGTGIGMRVEGPGISLTGLWNLANRGTLLSPDDARKVAQMIDRAADLLTAQ